jgi:phosphate transport system permease protein
VWKDALASKVMGLNTAAACGLLIIVVGLLVYRSWPILSTRPVTSLVLSEGWHPTNAIGFGAFIMGSVYVTVIAMVLAVPTAIFSAIYLAEYASFRAWIKPLVDLLASIPSVIYGLWGVLFVVPLVRDHIGPWADSSFGETLPFLTSPNPTGYGLLSAGFVPQLWCFRLSSITEEVMRSVPQGMREASLGAGRAVETTKFVVSERPCRERLRPLC